MKKKLSVLLVLLMVLVMSISVTGCKKEAGEEVPTGDVYVPEFTKFDADVDWVSNTISNGEIVSLFCEKYDPETYENIRKVVNINVNTGEQTEVDIDFGNNSYISSIKPYKDGYMAVVEEYSEPTEEELEAGIYEYKNFYKFVEYDVNFNVLNEIDLSEIADKVTEESGWFYVSSFAVDGDGDVYLCGGDQSVWVLDSTGKQLFTLTSENWINTVSETGDGRVFATYYDTEGGVVNSIIDKASKSFGDKLENMNNDGYSPVIPAGDGKLYIKTDMELYLYDINTQTSELLLNWIDCDINSNNISGFAALADGSFAAVSTTTEYKDEGSETTIELAKISKVPASSVAQKKTIKLALLYMDYSLMEEIIDFNKTNGEYRIKVSAYVNNDYTNYEEALTKFGTDMATGSVADIMVLPSGITSGISVSNLAAKGVLADLNTLMENDPDIKRDDFITNIFDILSVDGKLYGVVSDFSVMTLAGKVSDVGNGKNWTFAELKALAEKYPDSEILSGMSKEYGMTRLLICAMDSFYNVETGKCNFESQEFIDVLELVNTFPDEYEYTDEYVSLPEQLRSGKVLLTDIYMSNFDDIQLYPELYGEPINYIGFPTTGDTSGAVAQFNNIYTISQKSKNKEGAWQFIRRFLTDEYQNDLEWTLPVNKEAFEALIAEAMVDDGVENGWNYDGVEVKMGPLTEENAQLIRDIIYGVSTTSAYDEQIFNIINEEAQPYFKGEKSAKEVATIIQSRIQVYINENR